MSLVHRPFAAPFFHTLGAAALLALACPAATAQSAPPAGAKPPVRVATAATSAKQAKQASQRSTARAGALARDTVEQVNAAQLDVAGRVLTGAADCEFKQTVMVEPLQAHAGHFHVRFGKQRFTMVPQETTTGAVRLEDRKAGVVWLQIPAKSMLMNSRIGQRMVDNCTHAEQRASVAAVEQATGIGIVPQAVPMPVAVPASAAQ